MTMGSGRAHLFDNALPGADGVPIVELVLRKVELGSFSSVLNLVDCSLKLGLAEGHERYSIKAGRRIWEESNGGLCKGDGGLGSSYLGQCRWVPC